jgi:RimJ/RimL family protein N-acetyltransferase
MRGAAELRMIGESWPTDAEGAFSVEKDFQNGGVGTQLLGRIVRAARNRGVSRLYMNCLAENRKMQRLAKKYEASWCSTMARSSAGWCRIRRTTCRCGTKLWMTATGS